MSGVKGRSGGARPNTGGKRPGAGRKKKAVSVESTNTTGTSAPAAGSVGVKDPLPFLRDTMNDTSIDIKTRVRAAIAAAQYVHTKIGDGGKKDEAAERAKKAGAGRFKAAPAPLKLVASA